MVSLIFFWLAVVISVIITFAFFVTKGNLKYEAITFNALLYLASAVAKYLGL